VDVRRSGRGLFRARPCTTSFGRFFFWGARRRYSHQTKLFRYPTGCGTPAVPAGGAPARSWCFKIVVLGHVGPDMSLWRGFHPMGPGEEKGPWGGKGPYRADRRRKHDRSPARRVPRGPRPSFVDSPQRSPSRTITGACGVGRHIPLTIRKREKGKRKASTRPR